MSQQSILLFSTSDYDYDLVKNYFASNHVARIQNTDFSAAENSDVAGIIISSNSVQGDLTEMPAFLKELRSSFATTPILLLHDQWIEEDTRQTIMDAAQGNLRGLQGTTESPDISHEDLDRVLDGFFN